MSTIGKSITPAANLTMMYADNLLKGVTPPQFARFATGKDGKPVQSNHPAFVFGHLSMYPARAMDLAGSPQGAAAAPAGWAELFKAGVECRDDPAGTIYPAMDKVVSFYKGAYRATIDAVSAMPDETLLKPNPAEGRMKELFPTVGSAINFYLSGHAMSHLGQVSAWRRFMGMGSAT